VIAEGDEEDAESEEAVPPAISASVPLSTPGSGVGGGDGAAVDEAGEGSAIGGSDHASSFVMISEGGDRPLEADAPPTPTSLADADVVMTDDVPVATPGPAAPAVGGSVATAASRAPAREVLLRPPGMPPMMPPHDDASVAPTVWSLGWDQTTDVAPDSGDRQVANDGEGAARTGETEPSPKAKAKPKAKRATSVPHQFSFAVASATLFGSGRSATVEGTELAIYDSETCSNEGLDYLFLFKIFMIGVAVGAVIVTILYMCCCRCCRRQPAAVLNIQPAAHAPMQHRAREVSLQSQTTHIAQQRFCPYNGYKGDFNVQALLQ